MNPGPTTYADLHPGEVSFKEKQQALHPGTDYSRVTSYQTPDYQARISSLLADIHSRVDTIPWPSSYTPKTSSIFDQEMGLWPGSGSSSDDPTITANTANGGYANRTMVVTEGGGGAVTGAVTPAPVTGAGGILGALGPSRNPPTFPTPTTTPTIPTPGTVAPGDSPTSSITGAAVAGIAAIILLGLIK